MLRGANAALPAFANNFGDGDVLVGAIFSTLLFAALHTNPLGFFKSPEAFVNNFTLLILQIINGSIFALLYISTGNLAVPIIAHAVPTTSTRSTRPTSSTWPARWSTPRGRR